MIRLKVLQNEYLILSLGIAIVLLLSLVMFFLVMKRKRSPEIFSDAKQSSIKQTIEYIPWLLILIWVLALIYGIIETIHGYFNPPNW
jgi:hypothetical protein